MARLDMTLLCRWTQLTPRLGLLEILSASGELLDVELIECAPEVVQ